MFRPHPASRKTHLGGDRYVDSKDFIARLRLARKQTSKHWRDQLLVPAHSNIVQFHRRRLFLLPPPPPPFPTLKPTMTQLLNDFVMTRL